MAEVWTDVEGDLGALASALEALEGTELDEQVFVAARPDGGGQPEPLLDIAHMEEEPGDGRFQVYVSLPDGAALDDVGLTWPAGTNVIDDSGDNATVELGPSSSESAALALTDVARVLAPDGSALVWSTTLAE